MKRQIIPILIISTVIFSLCLIPLITAQGFDSISHPPDITVKQNDNLSISWFVTISSVTTPTYDVYRNGIVYISGFEWELIEGTGDISIIIDTGVSLGVYNYTIVVKDGAGHQISDEVLVTIEGRSGFAVWWSEWWVYLVFGTLLVGVMTAMVFIRRKGFKNGESII
ncbi:MAG: hypothetical protein EU530_10940 [Promethearchaeota archaeon]|nr:MAG: hypothetical protein EU530_10940 [Candidatus Lokiarchaeota archaeon]